MIKEINEKVSLIASEKTWIEGDAVLQMEKTAKLEGMLKVIGMPDLHPGKGHPIGASFISKDIFYPYLVGNDIGCGMALWKTDLKKKKQKLDKWVDKLKDLELPWEGDYEEFLSQYDAKTTGFEKSLGTIGGGNHFAELQVVEKVIDESKFNELNLDKDLLYLLTHSGSRGFGESILREHVDKYASKGLEESSDDAKNYIIKHNHAVNWAIANRALIAKRFLASIGSEGILFTDVCHNSVTEINFQNNKCWLHRKGASPSDKGFIVIPGSRGSYSYIVNPIGNQIDNGFSLAHGAGRKWGRSESKSRLEKKYSTEALKKTELGSYVICENKDLLYEEAPQAYKDIDTIIGDMVETKLIEVIAVLKPLITYKMRAR